MDQNQDIVALEQAVRTPFRSGGSKVLDENGKPVYLPGPERIPKTHGKKGIYLNNQSIGDIGAKLVANELKTNTECESLWLFGNGISHHGAAELAKGLSKNSTLTVLDLHDNKIGNEGARVLAQVLKTNTTLKILNICGNGIGPNLPQALAKHPTMRCLCFEVVTAGPKVSHDPWTTSTDQVAKKKCNIKQMIFDWNPGSMYGITGISSMGPPWDRRAAPTLYPGLTKIPNGLSGVSRNQPEFDPNWRDADEED
eukprot:CAMPEP_0181323850 /NCGR_PEP_ID=MMETSP1101-20121128/20024_1 /TAXON_ID=46948 /ORGANISM="Rhodomonas abbreviata, Strain Caron Lab Isolate" /LENGTH=253 /DNA_ID=CAMNT_0023431943 /DNA_START=75 /DNA_END=836 /DNA_ORIENTATION=+